MVSFVLPTRDGAGVARTIARDADPTDELLVVADTAEDPITTAAESVRAAAGDTSVEFVTAGEPVGCSGKCNALAAGTERAGDRLIVWTDDDFDHEGWVADVNRAIADHVTASCPAVSTAPVFLSEGRFARLLEGPSAIGAVLTLWLNTTVWGGTVAFRRDSVDVDRLVADLRRTVTDDALLTRRLETFAGDPRLVRPVYTDGTLRDTLSRNARWVQSARHLDPPGLAFGVGLGLAVTLGAVVAPLVVVPLVTLLAGLAYARLGVRRPSFLWSVAGYAVSLPLVLHGLANPEFEWGDRRYRWRSLYDVTVVDDADDDQQDASSGEPPRES